MQEGGSRNNSCISDVYGNISSVSSSSINNANGHGSNIVCSSISNAAAAAAAAAAIAGTAMFHVHAAPSHNSHTRGQTSAGSSSLTSFFILHSIFLKVVDSSAEFCGPHSKSRDILAGREGSSQLNSGIPAAARVILWQGTDAATGCALRLGHSIQGIEARGGLTCRGYNVCMRT
eukprot:TRINITY_DN1146_c1_g1_i1.p1 TRINITY_DN1146_c1_g1~~TRINITY_DN1146_c1_g1_i1.p1  ORF type:complete len:175 (+),score=40.51 TRINITY_DN1146_c1_g1_i1:574-1098(+)